MYTFSIPRIAHHVQRMTRSDKAQALHTATSSSKNIVKAWGLEIG